MDWLKPLNPRGQASAGDNNDTQVAWLRVGSGQAQPAQILAARKAFTTHLADIGLSLAGYHAVTYTLPDGSKLRIVSNSGIHHAVLWPAGKLPIPKLPHGFAVVTNWANPRIFKRKTSPTVSWSVDPILVPQARTDLEGDNQVFRATSATAYFNHPMVLTDAVSRSLWDYLKHGAPALPSSSPVVPICTQAGSDYSTKVMHYGIDNVIYNRAGTSIYTMTLSTAILVSPETPVHVPAATTAAGTEVVLQHIRLALTSDPIYTARFANERLTRLDEANYSLQERNVVSVVGPIGASTPPSGSTSSTLGESTDPDAVDLKITYLDTGGVGGSIDWTDGGGPISYKTYVVYDQAIVVPEGAITVTENATKEEATFTAAAATAESKTIALPAATATDYPQLQIDTSATGSVYWRAGKVEIGVPDPSTALGTSNWYGVAKIRKARIDAEYSRETAPTIQYDLGWTDFKLLEGSTSGECTGNTYEDTTASAYTAASTGSSEYQYTFAGDAPSLSTPTRAEWIALADPLDIGPAVRAAIQAYPYGELPIWGSPTTLADNRPINIGSYTLTSRYAIDLDHKGQFYAAIKVIVTCDGAEWRESGYDGNMVEYAAPDYTVAIYLETNWKGTVANTLLTTGSCTRSAFEFQEIVKQNPYYFLLPAETDKQDMTVRLPPSFGLPIEAMSQIKTICTHQGVNTHLVCADVRPDITGPAADKAQSTTGIEFSTIEQGGIKPHTKYVTGQLYARTFKISDFPDALWLLHSTKCDATEDDAGSGPTYFYMPTLKATIDNDTFHVEVRDGVHETWSDEFEPGPSQPAAAARDIKLYRV